MVLLLWIMGVFAFLLIRSSVTGYEAQLFVSSIVILGTVTAIWIYLELTSHLVGSIASLQESMDEIHKGNFSQKLTLPNQNSEFAGVIRTFNEMADALRTWQAPSNAESLQTNILHRAILEAIPSPVFVLGDEDQLILVNSAAEQLSKNLGFTNKLPPKIQCIVDECRNNKCHYLPQDPKDALMFRIMDEEAYFLPRIFRIDTENETHSGWAILLHNVSQIRWLDEMKTNLIATVSHEIKTPLTGIRMVLLLLLEERSSQLDKMQRTLISSASGDCERLVATLNGLLALSFAESGATHLSRIPICLQSSVEGAFHQSESAARNQGIQLRIEGNNGEFPKVLADPIRLAEVLDTLVSNAIINSPEGGNIILRLSKPDADHIRLSVIDEGAGVPESSQSRIFERFYRAPGQVTQGLGLGLFIARDIMTAHEGRIGLLERSENLTEFFIDVPIA